MNIAKFTLHDKFSKPYEKFCQTEDQLEKDLVNQNIIILVWSLDISGGTNVILQHCNYLLKAGAKVTIVRYFKQDLVKWHEAIDRVKIINPNELDKSVQYDLCILTWWRSFFELSTINSKSYIYFVQSIESRFYLNSTIEYSPVVEMTYKMGIPIITISRWIQSYLAFVHNVPSFLVKNGIDKTLFTPVGPTISSGSPRKLKFLIEGPLGVDFKQTELAIQALQKYRNSIEIILLTSSDIEKYDGVDMIFSKIPIQSVPQIMRSCDVLLKLSLVEGMFGPPLEIFHCGGTAITTRVSGCEEYMIHNHNCLLINDSSNINEIHDAIDSILNDVEKLNFLKINAFKTAQTWPDWDKSSLDFALTTQTIISNTDDFFLSKFNSAKTYLDRLDSRPS